MRILYISVHQILEYDELSIFHSLGHEVFSLGSYFGGSGSESFRPCPVFSYEIAADVELFERLGGRYQYGVPANEIVIPRDFVATFDVVVLMHEFDILETHWDTLSAVPVVWRSIGVGTQLYEPRVAAHRARGGKVVRYCPSESKADGYAGHDAVIRFGKTDYEAYWTGGRPELLTFSHFYRQRFPLEYEFYRAATEGLPTLLGGDENVGAPGALGIVDHAEQKKLFQQCAAYFYASGSFIPYTLNFMEAWLSGIPLVAINCHSVYTPEQCRFAEVPELIDNSVNGFLVQTPEEASAVFRKLANEPEMAREIGAAGARTARSIFSVETVGPQWEALFRSL